jgi:hypothetical protein
VIGGGRTVSGIITNARMFLDCAVGACPQHEVESHEPQAHGIGHTPCCADCNGTA